MLRYFTARLRSVDVKRYSRQWRAEEARLGIYWPRSRLLMRTLGSWYLRILKEVSEITSMGVDIRTFNDS
jgi:hypothetical protein